MDSALGLVETRGFLASVVGADAALKAALVTLKSVERVGGGLTAVVLTGEVAAMVAALSAAEAAASNLTSYCRVHLIPRLDEQVRPILDLDRGSAGPPATLPPAGDKTPRDPVYREKPRTVSPNEVVELAGPEEVLALEGTPDGAQELLPAVTAPDGDEPEPAAVPTKAPEPSASAARDSDKVKPAETKTMKPAARKSRKR